MSTRIEQGISSEMFRTVSIRFQPHFDRLDKALSREIETRAKKRGTQGALDSTMKDIEDFLRDASVGPIINQEKFQDAICGIQDESLRDLVSLAGVFVEAVQRDPSIAPDVAKKP